MVFDFDFESSIPSFSYIVDRYCDKDYYIAPTARNFHNFMFIVSGEGVCITENNELPLSGSMLVYNPPGQYYGYYSSKIKLMHAFGINFNMTSVSSEGDNWNVKDIKRLPFQHITHIPDSELLVKYFTALSTAWNDSKLNYNMRCRSIFLNILMELARQIDNTKLNHKITKTVQTALSFIRMHYMENISLEDICNEVNLTPSYFGKVFKDITGKTPFEYLHTVRIDKAEELLAAGYSITSVSETVGFNDPFYFSKVFKKIKGCCPREYTKNPSNFL